MWTNNKFMTWARQGSDVSAEFHHTRRERFEINWTRWTARWRHLTCRNHLRNPPKANTTRHKSIEKYWNLENSQFTKKCYKRFLPPVIKWSFPPNLLHDSLQKSPSNGQIGCDLWKNISGWLQFISIKMIAISKKLSKWTVVPKHMVLTK